MLESWLDHLRQHERVTEADRQVQAQVNAFHRGAAPPKVTHLIAPASLKVRPQRSAIGIRVVSLTSSITTSVLELRTPGRCRTSSPRRARWACMSGMRALTR